jgi:hypothetical protein
MNPIQELALKITRFFSTAKVDIDEPLRITGTWWLDITKDGFQLYIAWSEDYGFGVSLSDSSSFGAGHDKVFDNLNDTWKFVNELLDNDNFRRKKPSIK